MFLGYAKNSPSLIEPKCSSPFTQELVTDPGSEPYYACPHLSCKGYPNCGLLSSPKSSRWRRYFRFADKSFVYITELHAFPSPGALYCHHHITR